VDKIGDFLTRIRNAQQRSSKEIVTDHSILLEEIAKVLKETKFIEDYDVLLNKGESHKKLFVKIKYEGGQPVISELKRVSKPGVRRHIKYTDIKPVVNGFGIMILSTSKGVMTGEKAKHSKLGGEILCQIW